MQSSLGLIADFLPHLKLVFTQSIYAVIVLMIEFSCIGNSKIATPCKIAYGKN